MYNDSSVENLSIILNLIWGVIDIAARQVKCPHCQKLGQKEEMIKVGKRYWHEDCLNEYNKEKEKKKSKKKSSNPEKELDKQERKELIEYITKLFGTKPNGFIFKQMKDFHSEPYEYRYKAMEMTLQYFYEIQENSISNSKGIGIIPYVYDDAKKFFTKVAKINQDTENITTVTLVTKIKRKPKETRFNKRKIDMKLL